MRRLLLFVLLIGCMSIQPNRYIPERCMFSGMFICGEFEICNDCEGYALKLEMTNNAGSGLLIYGANLTVQRQISDYSMCFNTIGSCREPKMGGPLPEEYDLRKAGPNSTLLWREGETRFIVISFDDRSFLEEGAKEKYFVRFKYYPEASSITYSKVATGEIFAVAESARSIAAKEREERINKLFRTMLGPSLVFVAFLVVVFILVGLFRGKAH